MSSSSSFSCTDIFFAAAVLYIFGFESLTKIEPTGEVTETTRFHFSDVPSEDCAIYESEFKNRDGAALAITDLVAYVRNYTRLVGILKRMRRDGHQSWCSPAWIAGRG